MWYYKKNDELYHWSLKDFKPKYIAKVPIGGDKYRYFYTQASYQAYLNKSKTTPTTNAVKKFNATSKITVQTSDQMAEEYKKKSEPWFDHETTIGSTTIVKKGKISKAIDKLAAKVEKAKNAVTSILNKSGNTKVKDLSTKSSSSKNSVVEKGKQAVSKTLRNVAKLDVKTMTDTSLVGKAKKAVKLALNKTADKLENGSKNTNYDRNVKEESKRKNEEAKELSDYRAKNTKSANEQAKYSRDRAVEKKVENVRTKRLQRELSKDNPLPSLKIKETGTTKDQDSTAINPNYKNGRAYQTNCAQCAVAYDLRRRGYDVEALPQVQDNTSIIIESWYENGDFTTVGDIREKNSIGPKPGDKKTLRTATGEIVENSKNKRKSNTSDEIDKMIRETDERIEQAKEALMSDSYTFDEVDQIVDYFETDLKAQGEGARGIIALSWRQGGGHAVAYEIEDGEVVIRETQTDEKVNLSYYADFADSMMYMRTDNLTPTEECLKVVKNRGE